MKHISPTQSTASRLRSLLAGQTPAKGTIDLARQLGLSPQAAARRMRGDTPLRVEEVTKICAWLNVPTTDLIPTGR